MTKKELNMVRNYEWASTHGFSSVRLAYTKPSMAKVYAEDAILREMADYNGYSYYITGHNSSHFTCGYKYRDSEDREHLVYHTYANRFDIALS